MTKIDKYYDPHSDTYCIDIHRTNVMGYLRMEHDYSIEMNYVNRTIRGTVIEYGETRELDFYEIVRILYDICG